MVAIVRFLITMFSAPGTGCRNISYIYRIINPAKTVLEYITHKPIKKLFKTFVYYSSRALFIQINYGISMGTDLKMNCYLLNWLLLLVVARQW